MDAQNYARSTSIQMRKWCIFYTHITKNFYDFFKPEHQLESFTQNHLSVVSDGHHIQCYNATTLNLLIIPTRGKKKSHMHCYLVCVRPDMIVAHIIRSHT